LSDEFNTPEAQAPADTVGEILTRMERMIMSGELAPGAKLRELALADQLGVSRGPLREAIRVLEGRRLLERTPNAGVSVIAPTLRDCEELLVTREALEGMAARLAAENMTVDELDTLRHLSSMMEAGDSSMTMGVLDAGPDTDFHQKIASCSRNHRIEQLLCGDLYFLLHFFRARAPQSPRTPADTHAEHRAIIDAIHRRDGDAAERAMRAHVRRSRISLLERLRSQQR
jgi:DNA-binding GntR family transcriptional regulator